MALNPAQLTLGFTAILQAFLPSGALVAKQMALAYMAYAQGGQFGASVPTLLPTHTLALEGPLVGALLLPQGGNPANLAAAWAAGVLAFWLPGTPVLGAQVGTVIGCPGSAALSGTLLPAFSNVFSTAPLTASLMAAAIHAATITTTATVAPPPATVLSLL